MEAFDLCGSIHCRIKGHWRTLWCVVRCTPYSWDGPGSERRRAAKFNIGPVVDIVNIARAVPVFPDAMITVEEQSRSEGRGSDGRGRISRRDQLPTMRGAL